MGAIISFLRHVWSIQYPPEQVKVDTAIRIGLLGASWIAPMGIIIPAKSHPEVIIAAVAARDRKRADAYAKTHNIPIVHNSYEALLDDPSIDAVYNPLPNGLHYEWALRALRAGKHVLLEKPSTSNAIEAKALFDFHQSLPSSTRPVLLEAFHYRFHPAWQLFLSFVSASDIETAYSQLQAPKGFVKVDDIRFDYDLAGGTLMDLGTYNVSSLRQIFGQEPVECLSAEARLISNDPNQKCDEAFKATWRFPNGAVGIIHADLRKTGIWGLPWMNLPKIIVNHKPKVSVADMKPGEIQASTKTLTFSNFAAPHIWHSIQVSVEHSIKSKSDGTILKSWKEAKVKTAYTWDDSDQGQDTRPGAPYWTTYRYMLEEFVNKIKSRKGSGVWVEGEDSVKQMAMIDQGYEKAGLPMRPTSTYK